MQKGDRYRTCRTNMSIIAHSGELIPEDSTKLQLRQSPGSQTFQQPVMECRQAGRQICAAAAIWVFLTLPHLCTY